MSEKRAVGGKRVAFDLLVGGGQPHGEALAGQVIGV